MKSIAIVALLTLPALTASAAEEIVRRGEAIAADAVVVPLADVLAKPDRYAKKPVLVEGVISTSCTNKGCWMQVAPAAGQKAVRVTFKNYGFFIPLDAKGMHARAVGITKTRKLSEREADHLEDEGAKLTRNADGTVTEVSFVASGVELRK